VATIQRWAIALFVGLAVLVAGALPRNILEAKTAVLVETTSLPRCSGLDCPPWPVPVETYFCFQADSDFYAGVYSPLPLSWLTAGKRLQAWKGKPVEINVTNEQIIVGVPRIKLHLKRVHHCPFFRLKGCIES
jgi:hypothetical protein